jgi:hypothetical protein
MVQPIEQIHPPDSLAISLGYFTQLVDDLRAGRPAQSFRGELEYYCRDGSTIWTEVMALPTFDSQGQFQKLLGVSRSISERKYYEQQLTAVNQQLQVLATTDGLTGIWNRRHLETTIQQAMGHSDRYGEALSLILCDVDYFKDINDHFGHPVGDQVLGNAPVTLKGSANTGLPVLFQLLDGPATLSAGVLTLLGEGTVTVRARQVGSPLYIAAQVDQSFVIRKLTKLAVTVAGNQGGTVEVTPLKEMYAPADSVTLTATATSGFAFSGWSGDLTGSANPATLVMAANRAVTASFKDIEAPALTWDLPVEGTTGVEQVRLSGQIIDNVGVTTAQWSRDGGAGQALTVQANGSFAVDNVTLAVGNNRFTIVARDAAGNETKLERQVVWVPQRILTVGNASQVQEGQRMVFPVTLTSSGDVAGLTFELK